MSKVRIAILSDLHGNTITLEAVLADIQSRGGADGYWLLGDYAALGPHPAAVLERLSALPNAVFIRGNTDRYVTSGVLPGPRQEEVQARPELMPGFLDITRSFAWTQGALAACGWMEWLDRLALEQRTTLPDGTRVVMVHAAPGSDEGTGFHPFITPEEIQGLVKDCAADLLLVGHTHRPLDKTVDSVRVFNPGSLSNPVTEDRRAMYATLEADEQGYTLEPLRVVYDLQAVIDAVAAVRHPAPEFLVKKLRS